MTFVPKFEMQVRTCAEGSAVAYQGDGFATFHTVAFFLEQGAAVLVD